MELTLRTAVAAGLKITIMLLMLSLGLRTTRQSLLLLWRNPRLLVGSVAAAFVVVPVVTYLMFQVLPLPFGVKAGLWAVSITPGAPMIYRAAMKRGVGDPELAVSFQVTVALLVVLLAPVWLEVASALTSGDYGMAPWVFLRQVSEVQLIPILVGMALHRWQPSLAERVQPMLVRIGNAALIVLAVVMLAVLGPRLLAAVRLWTAIATVVMAASAIIGGHLLAGPQPTARLTIANANAQRNPGLALTIIAWSTPEHRGAAVVAIVVYVVIAITMTALYTRVYGKSGALLAS